MKRLPIETLLSILLSEIMKNDYWKFVNLMHSCHQEVRLQATPQLTDIQKGMNCPSA